MKTKRRLFYFIFLMYWYSCMWCLSMISILYNFISYMNSLTFTTQHLTLFIRVNMACWRFWYPVRKSPWQNVTKLAANLVAICPELFIRGVSTGIRFWYDFECLIYPNIHMRLGYPDHLNHVNKFKCTYDISKISKWFRLNISNGERVQALINWRVLFSNRNLLFRY